jgi:hypothetical protein
MKEMVMSARISSILYLLGAIVVLSFVPAAAAQDAVPAPEPRPSPLALTHVTLDDGTYIKIHYGSPRMRGRDIFGGLVPYGEVWRLGANEATEMTITKNIVLGGKQIPAGTYSLVAIPEEDKWTLVVNRSIGQWGAFSYSPETDLVRIEVPVEQAGQPHEAFTMNLVKNEGEKDARLVMVWDRTQVTVPITSGSSS